MKLTNVNRATAAEFEEAVFKGKAQAALDAKAVSKAKFQKWAASVKKGEIIKFAAENAKKIHSWGHQWW